jgi:tetratricopeptide (TPR) repeat protein
MKYIKSVKAEVVANPISTGKFLNSLYVNTSKGLTENEAVTFIRSGSMLLDFYAQAGAMRGNKDKALDLFKKAFAEDRLKAIRILFYLRDIRGGQGERDLFRVCLEWLGTDYPDIFEKIVGFVSEYGRWDDMFFDNSKCFEIIGNQIKQDKDSEKPSLLAKWLPTINASSKTTKAKAKFMATKLGMNEIEYRKTVRKIRKQIKIVEELMSTRKWKDINYSNVPSQASRIYKDAFKKHDETRYDAFIEKAEKGEVKINAGTLYPYQIYKSVQEDYSKALEALWNQLPDYTQGKNALVVADVSGSMEGDPMSVSVSLALYFAERNKGQFKDHFITFSGNPRLQRVVGQNLRDKMNSIETSEWEMNTNLQYVFDLILNTALQNNTPKEELPETIYIISDMEFDSACEVRTNFEVIKDKYSDSGYKMPNLVFWNVDARSGQNLPVQKGESGVALVSGFSPVIFKIAVENKTPEQIMLDTINSERYAKIKI